MPETSEKEKASGGTPSIQPPKSSSGFADTAGRSGGTLRPAADAPLVADKYRIVKEIGRGGMGAVYEVEHAITKHHRALKVVNKAGSGEHLQRLLREASAAGRVKDAHIVETLDAGTMPDGQGYIVMELLDGVTLFDYLRTRDRSKITDLVELIGQACDGLHAAHEAGIVHRDVKPGNLIVTKREGKPFVKIVDFGVSKFDPALTEATEITTDGTLLGTPSYMAPEQIRGEPDVDRRADVYALGIILYAATAGERPFRGRTLGDIAVAIANGEHTPLAERRSDLPSAFCATVEKAMARRREDRHATAKELHADLVAAIKREPELPERELTLPLAEVAPPPPGRPTLTTIPDVAPATAAPEASETAKSPWPRLIVMLVAALVLGGAIMFAARERTRSPVVAAPPSSESPAPSAATTNIPPEPSTANLVPSVTPTTSVEPPAPQKKIVKPAVVTAPPSAASSGKGPNLNRSNPYQ